MIMYFEGTLSGNSGEFGYPLINTIEFMNKRTGDVITLDRDESDISWEDDGMFSARWKGCYRWNGRGRNYDVCASDMAEYELHDVDLDEDFCAPLDEFELEITSYEFA